MWTDFEYFSHRLYILAANAVNQLMLPPPRHLLLASPSPPQYLNQFITAWVTIPKTLRPLVAGRTSCLPKSAKSSNWNFPSFNCCHYLAWFSCLMLRPAHAPCFCSRLLLELWMLQRELSLPSEFSFAAMGAAWWMKTLQPHDSWRTI